MILLLTSFGNLAYAQSQSAFQIKIDNLRSSEGYIRIALFDNPDDFPKEGKEYRLYIFPVHGLSADFRLIDIAANDYALAIFHDENEDGICNKNVLGIPLEGYGFSNNIFHRFRAPSFEEAQINVSNSDTIRIRMKY